MQKLTRPSAGLSSPLLTMENVKHPLKTLGCAALIGIVRSLLLGKICIETSFSTTWAITKFIARTTMNIAHFMAPHGIMQLLANRDIHSVGDFIGYCGNHTFSLLKNTTIGTAQFIGNGVKSVASATKNKISSSFSRLYGWTRGSTQAEEVQVAAQIDVDINVDLANEEPYLINGKPFTLSDLYGDALEGTDDISEGPNTYRDSTPSSHHYNLRLRHR